MKVSDNGGKGFDLEPGIYEAVCFGLIDIGTQHGEWQGQKKLQHQAIIKFELLDETYDDENGDTCRMQFAQFYTLSLHEKAKLRKHLNGWRGREFTPEELKGFEMKNVLGKNCMLVIGHSESGKSVVESVSKFKKEPVKAERELEYFSFEDFEGAFPEWMSDGIKNLCIKSDEYAAYAKHSIDSDTGHVASEPIDDDDVPFN